MMQSKMQIAKIPVFLSNKEARHIKDIMYSGNLDRSGER